MKINKISTYCIVSAVILLCCFEIMNQNVDAQEMQYSDINVEMIADEDGMAIVSGHDSSGGTFQVKLNYHKDDVRLKNTYYIDFTDDNKEELCLEMNIWNSVSPDFNTIIIYDIENDKILFPTSDKSFIYNGYIDQRKDTDTVKNIIIYCSYTKLNGTSVEDESSIIAWNGDSFETLEYQNKLLVETDEYIVYYNKFSSNGVFSYKLIILDSKTLETIQELELKMEEAGITEKIRDHELVKRINDESYDLYIEGYGIQHWNDILSAFK